MRKTHGTRVLYRFQSPKGQNYIGYCVWRTACSSPEKAAGEAFYWYWVNRKKSLSLLCRTMQKSARSGWTVEVLELVSASRAAASKTALIKKFKSSENDGGLNCANGRGRLVSLFSRIRHSQAKIGSRNPHTRADPHRIKELSKTLSSRKVAKILGIHQKTVLRHLRGEFGRDKYANYTEDAEAQGRMLTAQLRASGGLVKREET